MPAEADWDRWVDEANDALASRLLLQCEDEKLQTPEPHCLLDWNVLAVIGAAGTVSMSWQLFQFSVSVE